MKPSEVLRTLGYMQNCVDNISDEFEGLKKRSPAQSKKEVDFIASMRKSAVALVANCDKLLEAEVERDA